MFVNGHLLKLNFYTYNILCVCSYNLSEEFFNFKLEYLKKFEVIKFELYKTLH